MYLLFDQDWDDLERGLYLSWTQINAGGPKCGHYSSYPLAIIEVKPGALGQILHSPRDHRLAPEQKCLPSDQYWIGLGRGHHSSWTRINPEGAKLQPLSELSTGPLLKSGLRPLAISGRPRQRNLLSDPRSEYPAEGPLFKPACFRKFSNCLSR